MRQMAISDEMQKVPRNNPGEAMDSAVSNPG
jgi:hypothetical protein